MAPLDTPPAPSGWDTPPPFPMDPDGPLLRPDRAQLLLGVPDAGRGAAGRGWSLARLDPHPSFVIRALGMAMLELGPHATDLPDGAAPAALAERAVPPDPSWNAALELAWAPWDAALHAALAPEALSPPLPGPVEDAPSPAQLAGHAFHPDIVL